VSFDSNFCFTDFNTLHDRREINLGSRTVLILKQADHLSSEMENGCLANFTYAVSRADSLVPTSPC
jgi:hypothetical protein